MMRLYSDYKTTQEYIIGQGKTRPGPKQISIQIMLR